MNIELNFNDDLNDKTVDDKTVDDITNVEIIPQTHGFLITTINHANKSIETRDKAIATRYTTTSQSVITPHDFIISLYNGNLPITPIVVTGDVIIENNNFTCLPSNLTIQGKLTIKNCNNITAMPSKLHVNSLSIISCNNLTALADDIVINEELNITDCNKISKLQQKLIIDILDIKNCAEIVLSSNITVKKTLCINKCPKITNLPLNSEEILDIVLFGLNNIKLSDNFVAGGTLDIFSCNIILPENMTIKGDLILESCDSLECLPNAITVGGDIKISNCRAITALPSIWFNDVPNNLPINYNSFCHILLEKTSVPVENIENYNNILPDNIIVTEEFFPFDIYEDIQIEDLIDDIWQYHNDIKHDINLANLRDDQQENLRQFLYKLTNTPDFEKKVTRIHLANRVIKILQLITNNKMKEQILFIIHDAVSGCEDKTLLSLAEIEFLPLLEQAEQQSTTDNQGTLLKNLGKQQLYEDEVKRYAIKQASIKGSEQEEVEFVLAYKIKLAELFHLNFPKISMKHAGIPDLTNDDIELAYKIINLKVTDYYFEQWLNNWEPWKKHQRRWQLKQYSQLQTKPLNETNIKATNLCVISAEPAYEIKELVIYKQQIYNYESLCEWYIIKGTDPLIPDNFIKLDNIFAIKIDKDNVSTFHKRAKVNDSA